MEMSLYNGRYRLEAIPAISQEELNEITSLTVPEGVEVISFFWTMHKLSELHLPSTLTTVSEYCFIDCPLLYKVAVPDSVQLIGGFRTSTMLLCEIGSAASFVASGAKSGFADPDYPGVSLTYTSTTEPYTFTTKSYNRTMTDIVVPDGVTYIGNSTFASAENLRSVTLPEGVWGIGNDAFYHCSALTAVTIPSSVTAINSGAFAYCTALEKLYLPDGITSIDGPGSTFQGVGQLICGRDSATALNISFNHYFTDPDFPSLGLIAQEDENGLRSFTVKMAYNAGAPVVFPENVTAINRHAFYNAAWLTEIAVPEGVTAIGSSVFQDNQTITGVFLPEGVTTIGQSAFSNCDGLTSVILPEGVTKVDAIAFYSCDRLERVTLPGTLKEIGSAAFKGCVSLARLTLPEGLTKVGVSAFADCTGITGISFPSTLREIGNSAFLRCTALQKAVLPEGLLKIDHYAFLYCDVMTSITIPASVTFIGDDALPFPVLILGYGGTCAEEWAAANGRRFSDLNEQFTRVFTLPAGLTAIGEEAFLGSAAEKIILPEGCESIGSRAFADCTSLQCLVIPESVTRIAADMLGDTDVRRLVIVTPEGSAAAQWASEHGVCWINAK